MRRFLILSVMTLTLLVKGVSVQASEINQEYSADNSAGTANNTQINVETVDNLETDENLNSEEKLEEVEKITKDDCAIPEKMYIKINGNDENILNPLICKSSELFIHAKVFVGMVGYDVEWSGEDTSIIIKEIVGAETKKSAKEELKIVVDGTDGFLSDDVSYIPLNTVVEYIGLDYKTDVENYILHIENKMGMDDIKTQENMTLYRMANNIYEREINNATIINMVKLEKYNKNIDKEIDQFYFKLDDVLDGIYVNTKEITAWKSKQTEGKYQFTLSIQDKRLSEDEQKIVDEYINKIKEKASNLKTDEEKIKLINSEIVKLTSYNYNYNINDLRNAYDKSNTAYGAITNKKSVCQGYANLFTLLAEELDITVIKVRGYGKSPKQAHVWNSVYIEVDGKLDWYYVDSTWNDTLNIDKHLLTTAKFEENHRTWDKEVEQITRDIKYKNLNLDQLITKSITSVDIPI